MNGKIMINLGNGKYRPLEEIEEAFDKAKRLDSVLGSPYKITYHGAGKYTSVAILNHEHLRQLLEKAKEYDNFKKFNKIEDMFEFMNTFNKYKEKAEKYDKLKNMKGIDDIIRQRMLILNETDFDIETIWENEQKLEKIKEWAIEIDKRKKASIDKNSTEENNGFRGGACSGYLWASDEIKAIIKVKK